MEYKIETVTRAFLDKLFDSEGEKYEPFGLFIAQDEVDGKTVYVAVDNAEGEALTEEFRTRQMAVMWLHGYSVLNRWGEILEGRERGCLTSGTSARPSTPAP